MSSTPRTRADITALVRDSDEQARAVIHESVAHTGGFLPLVAALATSYQQGMEIGLALGLLHPGLAEQLLHSIDTEIHRGDREFIDAARAEYLGQWVEALNR